MHTYAYSCLVDNVDAHPYKAQILIHTLHVLGHVPLENIFVHVTDRVSQDIADGFRALGVRVIGVKPYLDRKYCNKLRQLDYFISHDQLAYSGLFLLDVDLAITEPLSVPDNNKIFGKIVDAPNPPLEVLEHIYAEAGISISPHSPTDWSMGATLDTNFNGGFIYIPTAFWGAIDKAWKNWAEYLFTRPHLFSDPCQRTHIDQISFSMAVAQTQTPYGHLTSNMNYPCHKDITPFNYDKNSPVKALHFHNCLDQFGLIAPEGQHNFEVHSAAEKANQAISEIEYLDFFELFKKSLVKPAGEYLAQAYSIPLPDSLIAKSQHNGKKRRLILHAGTPKTGTTSLQFFLNENREKLAEKGFWYPKVQATGHEPKHQELLNSLKQASEESIIKVFDETLGNPADNIHTIILSTEGLYNHWHDIDQYNKYLFSRLCILFDLQLWVWFREPVEYCQSFYPQVIANPQSSTDANSVFGKDISFEEMLNSDWFMRHQDNYGFIQEAVSVFGENNIRAFIYGNDTVNEFLNSLKIKNIAAKSHRRNKSLSLVEIHLLKVINRLNLDSVQKSSSIEKIKNLDLNETKKFTVAPNYKKEIITRTQLQWKSILKLSEAKQHSNDLKFDNQSFWNIRYLENIELGSGVGSRGETAQYKLDIIKNFIENNEHDSVLDIGCGDFEILKNMNFKSQYHGVDVSDVVIKRNSELYPQHKFTSKNFSKTSSDELTEFASDIVLCFDVLIHQHKRDEYEKLVMNIVNMCNSTGLISGYLRKPNTEFSSKITSWHEPLDETLQRFGAQNIEVIGEYRDTSIVSFTT